MKTEQMISKTQMLDYLQMMLDRFKRDEERFGMDEATERKFDEMLTCKVMVEALIGEPVNLQLDGKVTTGF